MSGCFTVDSRETDKGTCGRPLLHIEVEASSELIEDADRLIEQVEERTMVVTAVLAEILEKSSKDPLHHAPHRR
jgi:hypothetical protein